MRRRWRSEEEVGTGEEVEEVEEVGSEVEE